MKEQQNDKFNIAVIIPYINLPHYIIELVKTVKSKYPFFIYLIDNGSDEKTKNQLRYLEDDPKIQIIYNEKNVGCAGAWNMGLDLCHSVKDCKFAVILNNDILLHPEAIDRMIETSLRNNILLVSAFDVARDCNKPDEIFNFPIPKDQKIVDHPHFSCFTVNLGLLKEMQTKEEGIEQHPGAFDSGFYPAYFEDNDFHYRIAKIGQRGVYDNQALFYHYGSRTIRENKEMGELVNKTFLVNQARFVNKWGGQPLNEKFLTPFNKEQRFDDKFKSVQWQ